MKRIGLLGGTFNPIHIGHLAIAQMAQEKFSLEKVIFIPSAFPPHKRIKNLAEASYRYNMVKVAIRNNSFFDISKYEIERGGKSYSIDTVKYIQSIYPEKTKIYFIVGEDNFQILETWKQVDKILEIVRFIVVNRQGYPSEKTFSPPRAKYETMQMPAIDISSSYLRRRIALGKTIKYLVPKKVIEYIKRHNLYSPSHKDIC